MDEQTITKNMDIQQKELKAMAIVANRYSFIRAVLLVATIGCLYYGYEKNAWFYVLMCMALVLFFWFVRLHTSLRKEMELKEMVLESYQDILKRKNEQWKTFSDTGYEFLNKDTTQAYDLDIFGNSSLFQYLNIAKTVEGRNYVASLLSCEKQDIKEICKRQSAVKELIEKKEFNIRFVGLLKIFELHGRKKKKATLENFYQYMEEDHKTYPIFIRYIAFLLSLITIGCIVYAAFFHGSYAFALMSATISVALALLSVLLNMASFSNVSYIASTLHDYEQMFQMVIQSEFKDEELIKLRQTIENAPVAIRKLQHIMSAIQFRNDGIMFMVTNALFLIDFQCVFALEKWKREYGLHIRKWMVSLGKLEAYLSLAQFTYAKDKLCWPHSLNEEHPHMEMKTVYHPLIMESNAIANDLIANNKTYIVTGSNMSGKTTFLRTIGLNMVLFHAGAQVCASTFCANSMNIFTSMRIKDDVSEGISTFYAEILRIKSMIEESKKEEVMLVLIDEIFKGTNSADRIICAQEVLKYLHKPWVSTFVSTHDFELCTLNFKNKDTVENFHFEEYYQEDKVCFDYTLKKGRCTTTNAQALMALAGIPVQVE